MWRRSRNFSSIQRQAIITRLGEIETFYYFLNNDKRFEYSEVIESIKTCKELNRHNILDLKGINPSIFHEIDLILKGKSSDNISYLINSLEFEEIKQRILSISHYLK
jgi:hypothetical protein